MTNLVSPDEIEGLIGFPRHGSMHLAKWVPGADTIYVMHSQECVNTHDDLRDCPHSLALDAGVVDDFPGDRAVTATIDRHTGELSWAPWFVLDQWRRLP